MPLGERVGRLCRRYHHTAAAGLLHCMCKKEGRIVLLSSLGLEEEAWVEEGPAHLWKHLHNHNTEGDTYRGRTALPHTNTCHPHNMHLQQRQSSTTTKPLGWQKAWVPGKVLCREGNNPRKNLTVPKHRECPLNFAQWAWLFVSKDTHSHVNAQPTTTVTWVMKNTPALRRAFLSSKHLRRLQGTMLAITPNHGHNSRLNYTSM
jgi:hypothetical protein